MPSAIAGGIFGKARTECGNCAFVIMMTLKIFWDDQKSVYDLGVMRLLTFRSKIK